MKSGHHGRKQLLVQGGVIANHQHLSQKVAFITETCAARQQVNIHRSCRAAQPAAAPHIASINCKDVEAIFLPKKGGTWIARSQAAQKTRAGAAYLPNLSAGNPARVNVRL